MKDRYVINKLYTDGNKYEVFISHSNAKTNWIDFAKQLESHGIKVVSDKDIKAGTLDFANEIKKMIFKTEITILYVDDEVITPWMDYELGLATGLGKKIFLFSNKQVHESRRYLFKRYGPVFTNVEDLANEIKKSFFFSDLFEYESDKISKNDFLNSCMANIDICTLSFDLDGIDNIPVSAYRFGYILLAVARYEKENDLLNNCTICRMNGQEIEDGKCFLDNKLCSRCYKQRFENPTDTILNKILYNSNINLTTQKITFTIPFNKQLGVTFKCFVDVNDADYVSNIVEILEKAGLTGIGVSDSACGNRIYFMLPKSHRLGLFEITAPDGFLNNYLCKGAVL